MENSQSLATESFSYGWLTIQEPIIFHDTNSTHREQNFNFDIPFQTSHNDIVHADEIFYDGHIMPVYAERPHIDEAFSIHSTSFIDSLQSEEPRFSSESPAICVFLDQETRFSPRKSIECPGTRFFDQKESDADAEYLSRSLSSKPAEVYLLGKWRKSSKRLLQKCFGFVKPLCKTIGGSRKSIRVDDLERKVCEIRSCGNSLQASPRPSTAYSVVEWTDVKKLRKKADLNLGFKRTKSCNSSPQSSPRISLGSSSSCYDVESSIHEAVLHCKRSIGMLSFSLLCFLEF